MNQKASLVSLAVEKAWADAANAEEAKNNYLEMLKTDERAEATARHLEKITLGYRITGLYTVICSRNMCLKKVKCPRPTCHGNKLPVRMPRICSKRTVYQKQA